MTTSNSTFFPRLMRCNLSNFLSYDVIIFGLPCAYKRNKQLKESSCVVRDVLERERERLNPHRGRAHVGLILERHIFQIWGRIAYWANLNEIQNITCLYLMQMCYS